MSQVSKITSTSVQKPVSAIRTQAQAPSSLFHTPRATFIDFRTAPPELTKQFSHIFALGNLYTRKCALEMIRSALENQESGMPYFYNNKDPFVSSVSNCLVALPQDIKAKFVAQLQFECPGLDKEVLAGYLLNYCQYRRDWGIRPQQTDSVKAILETLNFQIESTETELASENQALAYANSDEEACAAIAKGARHYYDRYMSTTFGGWYSSKQSCFYKLLKQNYTNAVKRLIEDQFNSNMMSGLVTVLVTNLRYGSVTSKNENYLDDSLLHHIVRYKKFELLPSLAIALSKLAEKERVFFITHKNKAGLTALDLAIERLSAEGTSAILSLLPKKRAEQIKKMLIIFYKDLGDALPKLS